MGSQALSNVASVAGTPTGHQPAVSSSAPDCPNPLDRFRVAISDQIGRILGVNAKLVFDGLDRAATLDKGDLVLAIPRLRQKGVPHAALGAKVAAEVSLDIKKTQYPLIHACWSHSVLMQYHSAR